MNGYDLYSLSGPVLITITLVSLCVIERIPLVSTQPSQNFGESVYSSWERHVELIPPLGGTDNEACSEEQEVLCAQTSEDEIDPMLKPMRTPMDPNFKAYVRADISSFYQEPSSSRAEYKPKFKGFAGKFINISPYNVRLYWEDGKGGGLYMSDIKPWEATGTSVFPGHEFFFVNTDDPGHETLCHLKIIAGNSIYYFDPFKSYADDVFAKMQPWSRGIYKEELDKGALSLTTLAQPEMDLYKAHRFNLKFGAHYKNFTGGSEWLSIYPGSPPKHKMWRADYFGQEHHIQTKETHFINLPRLELLETHEYGTENTIDMMRFFRNPGVMNLTIKVLSCAPRAFEIRNFLSDVEVDHILELVKAAGVQGSTAGIGRDARISQVRTLKNRWLPRYTSPILDAIYRRGADALRIDEALLRHRNKSEAIKGYGDNRHQINEHLQIVHYEKDEQDTAHHDFGYLKGEPDHPSRSINLHVYLNEGMKGGQTSFPRWRNGETAEAINVTPEKGKAVIFYMVNPDGNMDDLIQHVSLPVISGEKWVANLWIWDPIRP